ncbi:Metallo-dependent phosphatase-like [Phytophthora cactorum]|nr:Metallo-dependent phosphatase-like [Phytophthora cactorum]
MLVNAGVLLAIVGISSCAAATCSSLESNTDYQGPDIGSAHSASVNGCCSICSKTNGCGAFTWTSYNGGTCWLKKSKGTLNLPAGANVGSAHSASVNGCCSICSKTNSCGAFTWTNYNGGTCWLKSSKGGSTSNPGAVSGVLQTSNSGSPGNPASAKYLVSAYAVGDWGQTLDMSSCCGGTFNNYDRHAQAVVGKLMDIQAGTAVKPKAVLGHGDSFYWTGIDSLESRDSRFQTTYESRYNGDNIKNVPWVNVMGNHDYGGANYVCNVGDQLVQCNSTAEMLQGLENKFRYQADYTSPNNDRWAWRSDAATGVSIDIFNIDMNDADVAGSHGVCCQCYGYAKDDNGGCGSIARGDKYCCGGDNNMYDTCMAKFVEWAEDSRMQLAKQTKASTATWKIVNSHFSPVQHYKEDGMHKWFDALNGTGIHAFIYGHTHGEKHDYSDSLRIHFVENGAGGGSKKEFASTIPEFATRYVKKEWAFTGDEYGFFSVEGSKDWLKLQYHTADSKWKFTEKWTDMTIGGVATKHCWYIPVMARRARHVNDRY